MFDAPLYSLIAGRQGGTRMHVPGHKGKTMPWLHAGMDLTELSDTEDLFDPGEALLRARALAASAQGAGDSILLSAGGTAGVLAMALAYIRPGDRLIMPRNVHVSALSACVLGQIDPHFVDPDGGQDPAWTGEDAILRGILNCPQARAVLVTSPDYYGRILDVKRIAHAAHGAGMALLVDAAHGAHLPWLNMGLDCGAMGADAWMASAHKTLPALTGGAFVNVRRKEDARAVMDALRLVHTSSPSFLTLASLDYARAWMDEKGAQALFKTVRRVRHLREQSPFPAPGWEMPQDPTRIVLDTGAMGISGWHAQAQLEKMGVYTEMADARRIVAVATVWDEAQDFRAFEEALCLVKKDENGALADLPPMPRAQAAMPLWQAARARADRVRPGKGALGRICAKAVGCYPPGIPLFMPGERIQPAHLEWMGHAEKISARWFGMENGMIAVVNEDAV